MPRYSIKLKRTADSFIHEYECDAADLNAASAVADAMATAGGGGFESPEVALVGSGSGVTLDQVYPVGCIYTSTVSTNPATVFGMGTWSAFGAGRCLVGLDSGQTEFDMVEETGGAKTHTLTAAEMPSHTHVQDAHTHVQNSHNHAQDAHSHTYASQTATTGGVSSYEHGAIDTSSTAAESSISTNTAVATNQAATATNQNATATNQNTGGGGAHNNLQPYIVVYFWKRTA